MSNEVKEVVEVADEQLELSQIFSLNGEDSEAILCAIN